MVLPYRGIEQVHVTVIMRNSVAKVAGSNPERGCGTRGTGPARPVGHMLNGKEPMDCRWVSQRLACCAELAKLRQRSSFVPERAGSRAAESAS